MSRLIFCDEYIIVIPSYDYVENHKHMMQHIFISKHKCDLEMKSRKASGNIILLDSDVEHKMSSCNISTLFLLVNPTSRMARQLRCLYFKNNNYSSSTMNIGWDTDLLRLSDEAIISFVEGIMDELQVRNTPCSSMDRRIEDILVRIKSGELRDRTVEEIAQQTALSSSRLAHLFKQETGETLKNYLLLCKMEAAYQCVLNGDSITEAAMNAGFSDSAHLAAACKHLTGISLSAVMKQKKIGK